MARKLDKTLADTLAKFHPNPEAAVWDCHGTWVIRHKDVELMAARAQIRFLPPQIIEASGERKTVAMIVSAMLGDVTDWATGEAAPANNKNAYPFAMAEKRARDRVAIKLLGLHGLYSEDEADDFKEGRPSEREVQEPTTDLKAVEQDLKIAAAKGTASLLAEWKKQPPHVRERFGGKAPDYLKTMAAEFDRRDGKAAA